MATAGLQHVVLIGLGAAHVRVLRHVAERRSVSLKLTVVSPSLQWICPAQLPGFVAGEHDAEACGLRLDDLVQRSGASWQKSQVLALDAPQRQLTLANGEVLHAACISLNLEPLADRARLAAEMPGALAHALPLHPLDNFLALWPKVRELAQARPLQLAVLGGHAGACELALAMADALAADPLAQPFRISLVSGDAPPALDSSLYIQEQFKRALRERHITVLQERCTGMDGHALQLGNGARLLCDAPVLAGVDHPPAWLAQSGLALDASGWPCVGADGQSTSHPGCFLVREAPGGGHPKAGDALTASLRAATGDTTGGAPSGASTRLPPTPRLSMYFAGRDSALAALATPWGVAALPASPLGAWRRRLALRRMKALVE